MHESSANVLEQCASTQPPQLEGTAFKTGEIGKPAGQEHGEFDFVVRPRVFSQSIHATGGKPNDSQTA